MSQALSPQSFHQLYMIQIHACSKPLSISCSHLRGNACHCKQPAPHLMVVDVMLLGVHSICTLVSNLDQTIMMETLLWTCLENTNMKTEPLVPWNPTSWMVISWMCVLIACLTKCEMLEVGLLPFGLLTL